MGKIIQLNPNNEEETKTIHSDNKKNTISTNDFSGYSQTEIKMLMEDPLNRKSPIQLKQSNEEVYNQIPILNTVKYLLNKIQCHKEVKLTAKGSLPVKLVAETYSKRFYPEYAIENEISKLYKETDSLLIHLSHILIKLSKLTKVRKGKISLTKNGSKILQNNHELLILLLNTFLHDFNWAYFDGFEDERIGQLGVGFSILTLNKYGTLKRHSSFYGHKYFDVFPFLIKTPATDLIKNSWEFSAFSLRTFSRFLDYFGLIKINTQNGYKILEVSKSTIFDQLINVQPHNMAYN